MDIVTRIKNSAFRKEVLQVLQSAKIHETIQGSEYLEEMPIAFISNLYMSVISKIVQDINKIVVHRMPFSNEKLLHDVVILALCKSRKRKKFDTYYDEIIRDVEKNAKLSSKLFI